MRVALITSEAPFGPGERFMMREAEALQTAGLFITAFPVHQNRGGEEAGTTVQGRRLSLLGTSHVFALLRALASRRGRIAIGDLLRADTRPSVFVKNVALLPFACRLAQEIRREGIDHIHAAWISIPASVAFLAAELTGVPWSFTAHRWDIVEGNAVALKVGRASFARTISAWGCERLRMAAPDEDSAGRVQLVHLGVATQSHVRGPAVAHSSRSRLEIVTIANMVPVKGHTYLLRACAELTRAGVPFRLSLLGDGPLRTTLEAEAEALGIGSAVEFWGQVPGRVVDQALAGAHLSVLASVTTEEGEHEGIPSSLIESMMAGVAVVATQNGSIPELVGDSCGMLVPERDVAALARAMNLLSTDESLRVRLATAGQQRVVQEFNQEQTIQQMTVLLTRAFPTRRHQGSPRTSGETTHHNATSEARHSGPFNSGSGAR